MTLQDKYNEIYNIHISQVKTDVPISTRPTFVVFSAIPGSGKSELSMRLERSYHYLLITNKLIRESIAKSGHENIIIGGYTTWFLNRLTRNYRPNIVFDRNIDQWYEPSKKWADKNKYQYVLVSIDTQLDILRDRLNNREGTTRSKAHEVLDYYRQQHIKMRKIITPTFALKDNYNLDSAAESIAKTRRGCAD